MSEKEKAGVLREKDPKKRAKALEADLQEALLQLEVSEKKRKTLERTVLRLKKELTEKKEWCVTLKGIIDGTKEFLKEEIELDMKRAIKADCPSNVREIALSETILMFLGEDLDELPMKLPAYQYSVLEMIQDDFEANISEPDSETVKDSPQTILDQVRQAFKILGDKNYSSIQDSNLTRLIEMFNDKSRAFRTVVLKNIADKKTLEDWRDIVQEICDLNDRHKITSNSNYHHDLWEVIDKKLKPLLREK